VNQSAYHSGAREVKPVNFALCSFAHFHAYSYARAVKELENARLVAAFDDDETRGRDGAARCGVELRNDLDKLLARDDIDAVVVTSETVKHLEHVRRIAEAGKHVLCEKPIATTLRDADEMVRMVRRTGIMFQTAFVMRYHSNALLVKDLVDQGDIGRIVSMAGQNRLNRELPLGTPWFIKPELSGGGAIMDHTVHLADLMRWLTGSEASSVYTEVGRNVTEGLGVEDNFMTLVGMRDGSIGTIDGSWDKSKTYHTWGDVVMEIIGTEGMILLDSFRQNVDLFAQQPPMNRLTKQYYGCDADKEMIRDFIRCIQEGGQPRASVHDGRQALEITVASYISARQNKVVSLPLST